MSETRREVLRNIAMAVTFAGVPADAAQHVHTAASEAKIAGGGTYKPKLFNPHEYATVKRLVEMIIPADEASGSAIEAGAPDFIDIIGNFNEDMGTQLTGGIAWLDRRMVETNGKDFLTSSQAEQAAMLDRIAYRKNATPELAPGVVFFEWMRRLTVDAFYTSPVGVKDIGYMGNKGMTKFEVPVAALEYAMKKSGLG